MRRWSIRLSSRAVLGLFAACLAVLVANPVARADGAEPPGCASPAPAALADFFDDALPASMARHRVPGAVVSVAAGGNTVFAKGYGQADTQRGVAFDAARSLVRIASITKLFTWTAVMQQVEAGRLDLNADVNRYLKTFTIPATYPEPVTLQTLMNHTAGFEDSPPRSIPFTFDPMTPEGAISTTAFDMAHFMVAHLHEGRFGTATILAPATAARMHEHSFSADPRLDGYAHGFKERTINGHRILMHDGFWEGFASMMMLVPGCDLGLFVSTNGTRGTETLTELTDTFFDRFTPAAAIPDATTVNPVIRTTPAAAQAGFYEGTRHNESTIEKLFTLRGPPRLTVGNDAILHFKGKNWVPRQDGLYHQLEGTDRLTFRTGTGGEHYLVTDGPSYQLMTRNETPPFNLLVLLAFALPALSTLAVPLAGVRRRILHRPSTTSATWRAGRWLATGAAGLGLAFLISLIAILLGDTSDFYFGVPLSFLLLLAIPVIALTATAAATACTIAGWRHSGTRVVARVHQIILLTGMAPLAWFLWQWNLIGWQLG